MGAPWRVALGEEADRLPPGLAAYVRAIPEGSVGVGHGRFDLVGTPHRWLRPLLRLVGGPSIFPIRAVDAPFTVRNTGVPGRAAVRAERRVEHAGRTWTMRDEIGSPGPGVVVDVIGVPPRLEVAFRPAVVDGALHLDSTGAALRLGPLRLPLGRARPGSSSPSAPTPPPAASTWP